MSRKQPDKTNPLEKRVLLDEFWTMIALLETRSEVKSFFKDLLSETESLMLARRVRIAKLLLEGKGYDDIADEISTSSATIASVHRWLQSGFGGYEKSLPRLEKEISRREAVMEQREEDKTPFGKNWMRKKYPLHYLLVSILENDDDLASPKKLKKDEKKFDR